MSSKKLRSRASFSVLPCPDGYTATVTAECRRWGRLTFPVTIDLWSESGTIGSQGGSPVVFMRELEATRAAEEAVRAVRTVLKVVTGE